MNYRLNPQDLNVAMTQIAEDWLLRAANNEIVVGIVGLGYVGLPLAEAFVGKGVSTVGFDISEERVKKLLKGESFIRHISNTRIMAMLDTERFEATTDISHISKVDAILLCVPTPLKDELEPDLIYVEKSCEAIGPYLRRGQMVILESTTWPGTSEEVMRPILERCSGLKAHVDFAIAYSPEREDPGNENYGTGDIPKVVGANTRDERDMACAIYNKITATVEVSDLKTAEAVKLMENTYRLVNIALINELNDVYKSMGIDTWEVVKAAKTKPFGFAPFYPGPGIGGHCIPIDPFYLTYKAKEFGVGSKFIELAGQLTRTLPQKVVEQAQAELQSRFNKDLNGAKILIVGLAYKKNIDDMRESPSLNIIDILRDKGAVIDYHDPHIPFVENFREHPSMNGMISISLTRESLEGFDCAIITTDHRHVDYHKIVSIVPLTIDTRNATSEIFQTFQNKIVKS